MAIRLGFSLTDLSQRLDLKIKDAFQDSKSSDHCLLSSLQLLAKCAYLDTIRLSNLSRCKSITLVSGH